MSAVKARLPEAPADVLREIIAVRRSTLKRAADAGQDDREQKYIRQAEINCLEHYLSVIDETQDAETQFAVVRELFAAETARRESLADETGSMFDNAFRFLEEAVGPSQELVLFVTEITAGFDTSWFVAEFGCDAYFRHNRDLLFDETRQSILDRLGRA